MGKEFALSQGALFNEGRERLRVENIQDIARLAVIQIAGELTPPDLIPLERHLPICEFCRDDLTFLKSSFNIERQAQIDYSQEMEADSREIQSQEDMMWENRF